MTRRALVLVLMLASVVLLQPARAQSSFNLTASVVGSQVTLLWDYPTPDPSTFLCFVTVNGGPETTCGWLNGDSRENIEYQPNGSYMFRLEAQTADGTVLASSNSVSVVVDAVDPTEVPTATPAPPLIPTGTATSSAEPTPTMLALTPIPTVVLQLTNIISTAGQVAEEQRAAWSLSAPTSPLLFGLTGFVAILALLMYVVRRFRP